MTDVATCIYRICVNRTPLPLPPYLVVDAAGAEGAPPVIVPKRVAVRGAVVKDLKGGRGARGEGVRLNGKATMRLRPV